MEFRSVVDAVRCAIEIQTGMVERNAGVPREKRIEFRIGIHLGDVVEENDGDLMGDGVNIAAAQAGSASLFPALTCLSEDVYRLCEVMAYYYCGGCLSGEKPLMAAMNCTFELAEEDSSFPMRLLQVRSPPEAAIHRSLSRNRREGRYQHHIGADP